MNNIENSNNQLDEDKIIREAEINSSGLFSLIFRKPDGINEQIIEPCLVVYKGFDHGGSETEDELRANCETVNSNGEKMSREYGIRFYPQNAEVLIALRNENQKYAWIEFDNIGGRLLLSWDTSALSSKDGGFYEKLFKEDCHYMNEVGEKLASQFNLNYVPVTDEDIEKEIGYQRQK